MKQEPLVSIVTPVFNGERYLSQCIESVLAQTYSNWDFTIVDNCSTDRTLRIAQEYAARDPRIRIHSNEAFVPVIQNYNIAFRQASPESKYCKPLAADDMLLPECLERMVGLAEENLNVAIVGSYGIYSRAEMGVYCRGIPYQQNLVPGRGLCRSYLLGLGPTVVGSASVTLVRSDVVRSRHAFYNESNIHADSEAFLEVLEHHDFGFVHQILTFKRVEEGSLTSHSQSRNSALAHRLHVLETYGPRHLTEGELKDQVRAVLREYYAYLASQFPKRRDQDFWDFHRGKLAAAGHPLGPARLSAAVLLYVLRNLLNPIGLLRAAADRLRGRRARSE